MSFLKNRDTDSNVGSGTLCMCDIDVDDLETNF